MSHHMGSSVGRGGGRLVGTPSGSLIISVASGENGSCLFELGEGLFFSVVVWVPAAEWVVLTKTGPIRSFLKIDSTFL